MLQRLLQTAVLPTHFLLLQSLAMRPTASPMEQSIANTNEEARGFLVRDRSLSVLVVLLLLRILHADVLELRRGRERPLSACFARCRRFRVELILVLPELLRAQKLSGRCGADPVVHRALLEPRCRRSGAAARSCGRSSELPRHWRGDLGCSGMGLCSFVISLLLI